MKVILKEDDEAKALFEVLANRVAETVLIKFEKRMKALHKNANSKEELWVSTVRAKEILGIKSNKKMQSLRDQNLIRFSQHGRIIRYHKASLYEFLENHIIT